ncbi:hypothetical protein [Herbiconiux liangxiaofengii]|uniref:hypothetical protein n=1 Tax=Herbiconiux liangxiaofengii TaxID=3342795 RepID=UPI0035BB2970
MSTYFEPSFSVLSLGAQDHSPSHHIVTDARGVVALIESNLRSGDGLGISSRSQSDREHHRVAWSRSSTIMPAALESSDLSALCAAVTTWEQDCDEVRRALMDDFRIASERAELASSELHRYEDEGSDGERGDSELSVARRQDARRRANAALAERKRLGDILRSEAEALSARLNLARPRTSTRAGTATRGSGDDICQADVVRQAIDELSKSGVVVTVGSELVDAVAVRLGFPRFEIEALWSDSVQMRGDILLALAQDGLAAKATDIALIATWNYLTSHVALLTSAEGRRSLLGQLIALVAQHEVECGTATMSWRNHIVCSVGVAETPRLSESLSARLQASEEEHLRRMSGFYENLLGQIGFRLVGRLRQNHFGFAAAMASVIEGIGIVRRTMPAATAARYGAGEDPDLTLASLLLTTVLDGLLEEDPDYDVDKAIHRLTEGLEFDTLAF